MWSPIRLVLLEILVEQTLALLVCITTSEPDPEGKEGVEADYSYRALGPLVSGCQKRSKEPYGSSFNISLV